jgi:hypothetical protein
MERMTRWRRGGPTGWLACAAGLTWVCTSLPAGAQIKHPGDHIKYELEVEPHFVYQWEHETGLDEGMGAGIRVSVPIIEDGPIKTINNSMAIGFGLDWTHFSDPCGSYYWWDGHKPDPKDPNYYYWNQECSANQIWLPVVLQWNFWLTKTISVFGEPGLGIQHVRWSYNVPCNSPTGWCEVDESDTDLEPVFWAGARFLVSDHLGITLRLGSPSFNAGVSLFF